MRAAKTCFRTINRSRFSASIHTIFRSLFESTQCSMSSSDRSEEYSGIIAFANTEKGFQGILKQRYTDFIVREIDPAGAIAQLTNLSGKELENRMFPPRDKPDLAPEALEEFIVSLRALIPVDDEKAAALKQFLAQAAARDSECPDAYIGELINIYFIICMLILYMYCYVLVQSVAALTSPPDRGYISSSS